MISAAKRLFTLDKSKNLDRLAIALSIILVFGLWQALSTTMPSYQFPGLGHLTESMWLILSGQTRFDPAIHYGISLVRIVIGFTIVMILGTLLGVWMGTSQAFEDYISSYVIILMTIPSVIWAFLAVIWWGFTDLLVPIFVIIVIILPYVTVNMWEGTKDIDANLLEMAMAFKLDNLSIWKNVYIPHLTPYTFATIRLAFALSWQLSLVAEIFGSDSGVGVVIQVYYELQLTDMIIAWALPMMILVFGIDHVFRYFEKRSSNWKPDTDFENEELGVGAV